MSFITIGGNFSCRQKKIYIFTNQEDLSPFSKTCGQPMQPTLLQSDFTFDHGGKLIVFM